VFQHAAVDAVDDAVGPERPIVLRIHFELIPRASLQTRSPAVQPDQAKLAALTAEITIKMRWRLRTPTGAAAGRP
jgi:hypothetical protein